MLNNWQTLSFPATSLKRSIIWKPSKSTSRTGQGWHKARIGLPFPCRILVHVYNSSTGEAESGRVLRVWGSPDHTVNARSGRAKSKTILDISNESSEKFFFYSLEELTPV